MKQEKQQTFRISDAGQPPALIEAEQTTCCIVGGGPAGVMLALMLAQVA